jgi:hypothetical protein
MPATGTYLELSRLNLHMAMPANSVKAKTAGAEAFLEVGKFFGTESSVSQGGQRSFNDPSMSTTPLTRQ